MNQNISQRGGTPVGYVDELDAVEAGAVLYLRLWCEGPHGQTQVRNEFASALGPEHGAHATKAFRSLCDFCMRHGRRPLMRHSVSCKCLGADESCFAVFVRYSTDGDREDALMMASTIVSPNIAPILVGLAHDFGIALTQMAITASEVPQKAQTHKETRTLH